MNTSTKRSAPAGNGGASYRIESAGTDNTSISRPCAVALEIPAGKDARTGRRGGEAR